MSILDIDNIISDETVLIKEWLDKHCIFICCNYKIHDFIVDVVIDEPEAETCCLIINTDEEYLPSDLFEFGVYDPSIKMVLNECPNLKEIDGLPSDIDTLSILNCPELIAIPDRLTGTKHIIFADYLYNYKPELIDSMRQYEKHKTLSL